MRGNISELNQLASSLSDAVDHLEILKNQNKIEEFNKVRQFILDIQKKIGEEIS